jgi:hypothetical protein
LEQPRGREPETSSDVPSSAEGEGQVDSVESDQDAVIILSPDRNRSVHPLRRLADEILPYLRELDDREWTSEEREFIVHMERWEGRPLTEPEKRMAVAQARMIGYL